MQLSQQWDTYSEMGIGPHPAWCLFIFKRLKKWKEESFSIA